jgi:PAS domain S-box-containing protein
MDGSIRVLHVDDEPDLSELTATYLEQLDERFTVETADGASEGLAKIDGGEFDCVVSDYDMPEQNGIEFLQSVRETYPDLPFVLFTGKGSEEVASDAISAGVTDYLQKQTGTEQYELLANRITTAVGQYRAEHELERQSDLFSKTQDLANVGGWEWYPQREEGYYSEQVFEIYGVDDREGSNPEDDLQEFYHPEDRDAVREAFRRAVGEGQPYDVEARLIDANGEEKWVRTRGDPKFEDGRVVRVRGTLRDITERKERTQELQRYERIVEASGDAIYALDTEGCITMVNDTHVEWSGYPREELIGAHVSEFMPAEDVERGAEIISEILSDPEKTRGRFEMRGVRPEGDVRRYENNMAVITDEDGSFAGSVGIIRDITDRKRREQALEELNEATREFIDAADKESVAEAAVETAQSALGMEISGLWLYEESADALSPVAHTDAAEAKLGESPSYTGDESLSWRAFQTGEMRVVENLDGAQRLYNPETDLESEIIVPLGDHGVMNLATTESSGFSDSDVSLAQILGNSVEAALSSADREQRLRRRREEVDEQNERLSEFVGVVSHDLRKPLTVADGHLELADEHDEHVAAARDAISRGQALIDDLLTLAQQAEVDETEPVSLPSLLERCWEPIDGHEATLTVESERPVMADRRQLEQLLANLLRNAVDHGGPDVTIRVGALADGFYVEDDGPGVPETHRSEVFEAGYSTAEEGTGFGLRIVEQVADAHGWDITLTEGADGGARFEITGVTFAECG